MIGSFGLVVARSTMRELLGEVNSTIPEPDGMVPVHENSAVVWVAVPNPAVEPDISIAPARLSKSVYVLADAFRSVRNMENVFPTDIDALNAPHLRDASSEESVGSTDKYGACGDIFTNTPSVFIVLMSPLPRNTMFVCGDPPIRGEVACWE